MSDDFVNDVRRHINRKIFPRWQDVYGWPALLLLVAVLLLVLIGTVGGRRTAPLAMPAYCSDVATVSVPRCPPEIGSTVLARWPGGSQATVLWTGREWQLKVPGEHKYKRVPAPHDWSEL